MSQKSLSAAEVYDLLIAHRLQPADAQHTISVCRAASGCSHYLITDGENHVADVLISDDIGGVREIDLVPNPKAFASWLAKEYEQGLSETVVPLLRSLLDGGTRRISAVIPASRSRTKKALRSMGFMQEGRQRQAILFYRYTAPEDLILMGLLPADLAHVKEESDG